jgi:uncharacterized protein (TIGR02996 family)
VSDEQGLLAAVIADPEDDAPRLVYADWCEDHGRPQRARFIRLQCRIARGDEAPELLAEEEALYEAHRREWVAQLPSYPGLSWTEGDEEQYGGGHTLFRRGFVSELAADHWQALSRNGARAFAAAPVTRLRVKKLRGNSAVKFARWPLLSRVEELELGSSAVTDEQVFDVGQSTYLTRLRVLSLTCGDLTEQGGIYLRHASWLVGLRELELGGNRFGQATCRTLASLSGRKGSCPTSRRCT